MNIKILLLIFILSISVEAQNLLKIKYEVTTEIDINNIKINGISLKDTNLADAVLESSNNKYYYELLANQIESTFYPIEKINNEQPPEPGSIVVINEPGGKNIYKNFQENTILDEKNFFNKKFITTDSLKNYKWTLTNERKTILDYEVVKSVSVIDSTKSIIAWYAPKIPFKDGPFIYWGLPGLILELEIINNRGNNNKSRFLAIEISTAENKNKIKKPEKGDLVSTEEYQKMVEEYQEKQTNYFQDGVDTSN